MSNIRDRLLELGEILPDPAAPAANYRSHRREGRLISISGQIPQLVGSHEFLGRVGAELDVETGYRAAKSAALALVAQIDAVTGGDIGNLAGILHVRVFIAATPNFFSHSHVADGVSDILTSVFGAAGEHARTAIGVASLPAGAAVEVDALIALGN